MAMVLNHVFVDFLFNREVLLRWFGKGHTHTEYYFFFAWLRFLNKNEHGDVSLFPFCFLQLVSEINSKRYDIYCIWPNYIYLYYALEIAQEKNSITVCLVHWNWRMSALSIFFLFVRRQLMLLFLYFAIFGFSYCRYYYEFYFISLSATIQSQYEIWDMRRPKEWMKWMNEKRINTAQFNLSLSINHSILCEHTTRHTFGLLRGFSLGHCCLVMIIFIDLWPVPNKRCENFSMQSLIPVFGSISWKWIITIFFFVYSGLLN